MNTTTRRSALFLLLGGSLAIAGDLEAPKIGFVLDRRGDLRPVYGVAGNFILGEPILEGITEAAFTGREGIARRGSEVVVFDASGHVKRIRESNENEPSFTPSASIENDEVVLPNGVRLRLPSVALAISQMGHEWLAVVCQSGLYAVSTRAAAEAVYALPEVAK